MSKVAGKRRTNRVAHRRRAGVHKPGGHCVDRASPQVRAEAKFSIGQRVIYRSDRLYMGANKIANLEVTGEIVAIRVKFSETPKLRRLVYTVHFDKPMFPGSSVNKGRTLSMERGRGLKPTIQKNVRRWVNVKKEAE